ncbi:hypothetical protein [Pseudomonas sp. Q1-7]|uniref:hypothetical protein n=1 Tax=Pseudomonas sp. Q1-7 TaxID=3020843 RepID=UPI0022FFFAA2|nr:hypothetical protein [Pseudomonas sp. Q1-7]
MYAARLLIFFLLTVGLGGCAASVGTPDDQRVDVRLAATQQNAGRIGMATLVPRGDETAISLFVSGVPSGVTRPVHLYTYIYPGTCSAPGATPAYELNRTVNTYRHVEGDVWRLSKSAPVPLSTLRASEHSLVLRTSPADGGVDVFCGDIR